MFALPLQGLAWLGARGTHAIAVLVLIAIVVPPIGRTLEPFVTPAVFLLLCISFMRVDVAGLRFHLRRPWIIAAATAWSMLVTPLLCGVTGLAIGLDKLSPALFLGLMLQTIASPMMATPALAALVGLDTSLVLIVLVAGTLVVSFSAPLFAYAFLGATLSLSPFALGLKLFAILAGSLVVAMLIRRIAGPARIARHKQPIDGLNILLMLVFVSAVMDTVAGSFLAAPLQVLGLALVAFVLFFAMFGLTVLIFRSLGRAHALSLGLVVSQRNMGLMLAATEGALPGLTWLYFAMCQFPIYLAPFLLKQLVPTQYEVPLEMLESDDAQRSN
jgi:predicted Na+-dependent transporter